MLSPDIKEVKQEVDNELSIAFRDFVKNRIKELKAEIQKYVEKEDQGRRGRIKAADALASLHVDDLRKEFFKFNHSDQQSAYERSLKSR